ncbi:hypothetical protein H4R21_003055 [Coemansia helicoidea]|uniref:Uncharacterized protein n=1 Tax=Coemansia helicoidea TaxID=1286919 RepID=A0ACC1L4Q5_9FUNG|nr:hypothetical protein H4R21_003055 [Coemansia helicoidea]
MVDAAPAAQGSGPAGQAHGHCGCGPAPTAKHADSHQHGDPHTSAEAEVKASAVHAHDHAHGGCHDHDHEHPGQVIQYREAPPQFGLANHVDSIIHTEFGYVSGFRPFQFHAPGSCLESLETPAASKPAAK